MIMFFLSYKFTLKFLDTNDLILRLDELCFFNKKIAKNLKTDMQLVNLSSYGFNYLIQIIPLFDGSGK